MAYTWNIPLQNNQDLAINLDAGSRVFVVGANGSGKSALIQRAVQDFGADNTRRISAHRQTWLQSGASNMTPQTRRQFAESLTSEEPDDRYRYSEFNSQQRISSVLFDLTAAENDLARRIMAATYAEDLGEVDRIREEERPIFDRINELLTLAGLAVTIENSAGEELLARHRRGNQSFSIAQMSDGERSAVIIAADVLTVKEGTIILVDEPERHMHRSIIEPFLSALFAERPDCPFVVSTHEVALPLANPDSQILMVRSCQWDSNSQRPSSWDIQQVAQGSPLPNDLKRALLGAKKLMLFVEGNVPRSLDFPMYSALFPDVSIRQVGSSDEVVKAVRGLRESKDLHDVEAMGLIDRDNLSGDDVAKLQQEAIYALQVCSVESLYYCKAAMVAVAEWQASALGYDAIEKAKKAKAKALDVLRGPDLAERMAARRCERIVRDRLLSRLPGWKQICEGNIEPIGPEGISLEVSSLYEEELAQYNQLLDNDDLEGLIARYPVRDSQMPSSIASSLELSKDHYERILVSRVRVSEALAIQLREFVQPLSEILSASQAEADPVA